MSFRALLTTLILGSSTIAVAQPYDREYEHDRDHHDRDHDRDREHGHERSWWHHDRGYELSVLPPMRLDHRVAVPTAGMLEGRSELRIESRGSGRTRLDRVTLVYSDRAPRTFRFDRALDANAQSVSLPLGDAKDVTEVIVTGRSYGGASIAIDAV
jgi:hypothetical protein